TKTGRELAGCATEDWFFGACPVLAQPPSARTTVRNANARITPGSRNIILDYSTCGMAKRPESFRTHSFCWRCKTRVPRTRRAITRSQTARPTLTPHAKQYKGYPKALASLPFCIRVIAPAKQIQ